MKPLGDPVELDEGKKDAVYGETLHIYGYVKVQVGNSKGLQF